MLHPSFNEIMKQINDTREDAPELKSRYSLVIATARRARQINDGSEPLVECSPKDRNLSVAVKEFSAGKIHLSTED